MTLRDRVENNVAIWLLGALSTGFLAGIAAYKGIIEMARLTVVSQEAVVALREANKRLTTEKSALQNDKHILVDSLVRSEAMLARMTSERQVLEDKVSHLESLQSEPAGEGQRPKAAAKPTADVVAVTFENIFTVGSPFPRGLEAIMPGVKLSRVIEMYPGGLLNESSYWFRIPDGPFSDVSAFHGGDAGDPDIFMLAFGFRNGEARGAVRDQLLAALSGYPMTNELLGQKLRWADVDGCEITLSSSYVIWC